MKTTDDFLIRSSQQKTEVKETPQGLEQGVYTKIPLLIILFCKYWVLDLTIGIWFGFMFVAIGKKEQRKLGISPYDR